MKFHALAAAAAFCLATTAEADPVRILFVGNSYTFGRLDPVMRYNAANVHDLTAGFAAINASGTNAFEPHPWGGVPGIFKQFTTEVGLDYDVSISARNAATLRGQFLDSANSDWKLRENVASQRWDDVVLQEQSDAVLPAGRGKNANLAQFDAYAGQFERFIHGGAAQTYKETALYGSVAACMATGLSATSCNTNRVIGANVDANPKANVYLTETWARPDMVYPHLNTVDDPTSPIGSPIVDTSQSPGGTAATLYYGSLAAMTADLHAGFAAEATMDPYFAGVLPVGDAFQYAFDHDLVKTGGFYDAGGVFVPDAATDLMNLWFDDYLHASKYGSYLDALVQFGVITGVDPRRLGSGDQAARDLGIDAADALTLQRIAAIEVGAVPEPQTWLLLLGGLWTGWWTTRRRARQDGRPSRARNRRDRRDPSSPVAVRTTPRRAPGRTGPVVLQAGGLPIR